MSLTPGFAPDARLQWRELDSESQEIALDLLDHMALNPPASAEHVADNVRREGEVNRYVFVHVLVARETNSLTVIGVGGTTRPIE